MAGGRRRESAGACMHAGTVLPPAHATDARPPCNQCKAPMHHQHLAWEHDEALAGVVAALLGLLDVGCICMGVGGGVGDAWGGCMGGLHGGVAWGGCMGLHGVAWGLFARGLHARS